jgi:hypothetical protein
MNALLKFLFGIVGYNRYQPIWGLLLRLSGFEFQIFLANQKYFPNNFSY